MNAEMIAHVLAQMLRGQFPSRPDDKVIVAAVPEGLLLVDRDGAHVLVSVRRVELS